jgi:hypothetical protein
LKITNSAPSKSTLGSLNGLAQGVSAIAQVFGSIGSGALWSRFVDADGSRIWPMGSFFTWNVVGVICFLSFVGSCRIRNPTPSGYDDIVDATEGEPSSRNRRNKNATRNACVDSGVPSFSDEIVNS